MDHQPEEQQHDLASVDNRERRRLLAAASSAAVLGGVGAWGRALAQDPGPLPGVLRILVGSAGAGPDLTARVVAEQLRAAYGWNVVVENRLGAGGRIAIEATRNAPPDGMTLMLVSIELLSLYPLVYTRLGYDPFNDFANGQLPPGPEQGADQPSHHQERREVKPTANEWPEPMAPAKRWRNK